MLQLSGSKFVTTDEHSRLPPSFWFFVFSIRVLHRWLMEHKINTKEVGEKKSNLLWVVNTGKQKY